MGTVTKSTGPAGVTLTLGGSIVIALLLILALVAPWRSTFPRRAPSADLRVDGRSVVLDEPAAP